jgi:hypothetical protein
MKYVKLFEDLGVEYTEEKLLEFVKKYNDLAEKSNKFISENFNEILSMSIISGISDTKLNDKIEILKEFKNKLDNASTDIFNITKSKDNEKLDDIASILDDNAMIIADLHEYMESIKFFIDKRLYQFNKFK